MTPEQHERLADTPDGSMFPQYLLGLSGPLEIPDLVGHFRSLSLPEFLPPVLVSTFLAAPIRHQGLSVGNIHVAKEEPGEGFSREDEETLVMFASQVALVLANARRHRDERSARAGRETLTDTSPVGVAVFDIGTGAPLIFVYSPPPDNPVVKGGGKSALVRACLGDIHTIVSVGGRVHSQEGLLGLMANRRSLSGTRRFG